MRFTELIKSAFQSLWSRKIRSFLTMLGVIIGVFTVAALLAVGEQSIKKINESFADINVDTLNVSISKEGAQMEIADFDQLAASKETVDCAAPFLQSGAVIGVGNRMENTTVVGTTWSGARVRDFEMESGHFLTKLDIDRENKSVVLGYDLAQRLFGDSEIIGQTVNLDGKGFTVVGVLAPMPETFYNDPSQQAFIPITTGRTLFTMGEIKDFIVKAASVDDIGPAKREIYDFLADKFLSYSGFTIMAEGMLSDAIKESNATMVAMLAGIGGIALLVSGIGIMNIMLVSVRERTREIGIRKAIGASRRDVLIQFIIEAMALSCIGGIVGSFLTFVLAVPIGELLGYDVMPSLNVIMLSVLFSLAVGILFGFYPAASASKLRPVDALHYE